MQMTPLNPNQSMKNLTASSTQANTPSNNIGAFQKYLSHVSEATSATPSAAASASANDFDPFAVVRSGAVSENNGFVLALERMYGIEEGSLTHLALSTSGPAVVAATANAPSLAEDSTQQTETPAALASVEPPATKDNSLSAAISDAVQKTTAEALQSNAQLDGVLGKLIG